MEKAPKYIPLLISHEQELDGRWIAEIAQLPGVLAYGETKEIASQKVFELAQIIIAEKKEAGEEVSSYNNYEEISIK